MKVEVSLFGAFRGQEPDDRVALTLPDEARVAALRVALVQHARNHWPDAQAALLRYSAFASPTEVLRDADAIPVDGRMAVLPPVSGG